MWWDSPMVQTVCKAWDEALEKASRAIGETWKGPSGRWFTKRSDGRVVPARDPEQRAGGSKGAGDTSQERASFAPEPSASAADGKRAASDSPSRRSSGAPTLEQLHFVARQVREGRVSRQKFIDSLSSVSLPDLQQLQRDLLERSSRTQREVATRIVNLVLAEEMPEAEPQSSRATAEPQPRAAAQQVVQALQAGQLRADEVREQLRQVDKPILDAFAAALGLSSQAATRAELADQLVEHFATLAGGVSKPAKRAEASAESAAKPPAKDTAATTRRGSARSAASSARPAVTPQEVADVYERASRPEVTEAVLRDLQERLSGMSKADLLNVAAGVNLTPRVLQGRSKAAMVSEIVDRIRKRKGVITRAKMTDKL